MKKIIAIVGGQRLLKSMLNRLINSVSELSLERVFETHEEATGLLAHPVDIVLIDIGDAEDNREVLALIRKFRAATKTICIVFSLHTSDRMIRQVFEAGAFGFIKLDAPYDEIMRMFRLIVIGGVPVSDVVTRRLISFLADKEIRDPSLCKPDKRSKVIVKEACKLIDAYLDSLCDVPKHKMSDFLVGKLHVSYGYLSVLFHEEKGVSIREYVIRRKIEKVKLMMRDQKISLSQIANKLDYSSVAHLSSQFLKVVGINPSTYRSRMLAVEDVRKSSLDDDF